MIKQLKSTINSYFVGKEDVVDNILICLLSGGHVLLEDVPGVGKTTAAKTLAKAIACSFGRIQFTPDTLPSDVTGLSVYDMASGRFVYREGAVMHQILLADEINRTSPKTQASLLEAMEEHQVTVDGNVYPLPNPFMVIATQNPIEYLGTYPLPESQMDRFMMRLTLGYPERESELLMARNYLDGKRVETVPSVLNTDDILKMMDEVSKVHVSDGLLGYARNIIDMTRKEEKYVTGASPRALLHLIRASQGRAYLEGRDYVKPDDMKAVAVHVLYHRLSLTAEARLLKEDAEKLLENLVLHAVIPME